MLRKLKILTLLIAAVGIVLGGASILNQHGDKMFADLFSRPDAVAQKDKPDASKELVWLYDFTKQQWLERVPYGQVQAVIAAKHYSSVAIVRSVGHDVYEYPPSKVTAGVSLATMQASVALHESPAGNLINDRWK
jgi:hypothetical protein